MTSTSTLCCSPHTLHVINSRIYCGRFHIQSPRHYIIHISWPLVVCINIQGVCFYISRNFKINQPCTYQYKTHILQCSCSIYTVRCCDRSCQSSSTIHDQLCNSLSSVQLNTAVYLLIWSVFLVLFFQRSPQFELPYSQVS